MKNQRIENIKTKEQAIIINEKINTKNLKFKDQINSMKNKIRSYENKIKEMNKKIYEVENKQSKFNEYNRPYEIEHTNENYNEILKSVESFGYYFDSDNYENSDHVYKINGKWFKLGLFYKEEYFKDRDPKYSYVKKSEVII